MRSVDRTEHLVILKNLHGIFPSDLATRRWRIVFIVFGWIIVPGVAIGSVLEGFPPTIAVICMATGLLALGLTTGYLCWIAKDHRFRFEDGEIKSVGRKTLWRLAIRDIQSVRTYRSGAFVIWWLKTPKTEKGLRIYPSLRTAIHEIVEQ